MTSLGLGLISETHMASSPGLGLFFKSVGGVFVVDKLASDYNRGREGEYFYQSAEVSNGVSHPLLYIT